MSPHYTRRLRRLEQLLRAHEAVSEALHEAAEDVLEATKHEKTGPGLPKSGPFSPYRSADFEKYVRRAWTQAKSKTQRAHARRMLRDGIAHGLVDAGTGAQLEREFGDED